MYRITEEPQFFSEFLSPLSRTRSKEQESQSQGYWLHLCLIDTSLFSDLSDLPEKLFSWKDIDSFLRHGFHVIGSQM